ncbi:sigma-70 family RNA polymerase sigma factor [Amycolatopsis acidicola]|uniref:Sigma-70 family RNA polymerase sigma factor n=1 Tax=Amycolatopsis acidicola TaxID=2596893 RepID=A0A5N0VMW4_9PSEU|nr:sigma-70 family RNA polymerase sigma factor [Amycolatopsis acidicola]KAA9165971.1 sigma-70 family RNA polymerase sigma factor [Amycolatopsis acidicola]
MSTSLGSAVEAWDLVDRTRTGDIDAFSDLYRRHYAEVFDFVLVRARNWTLAEEITAETFCRALRRIDSVTYRGSSPAAWLSTIARNIIIDEFKSSRRRREVPWLEGADWPGEATDPGVRVCQREAAIELHRSMAQLTDEQRRCLTLRFFEHRPVAEVARLMRKSEGSVRALQNRAVRRLGDFLTTGAAGR